MKSKLFKCARIIIMIFFLMVFLLGDFIAEVISSQEETDQNVVVSIFQKPKIDIIVAKARTATDIATFDNALNSALQNLNVDTSDVKIQSMSAEQLDLTTSFQWQKDVNGSIGSISIPGSGNSVEMTGNPKLLGKNAIYIIPDGNKEQKFTFSYNLDFGDSFNAAGMLLRVKKTGNNLTGYMLSLNNYNWTGIGQGNGSLWKFTYPLNQNTTNFTNKQLITGLNIATSGSLTVEASDSQIKINGSGANYTYQIPGNVNDIGNGFGFFSDHYSHNCQRIGSFKLSNITLTETSIKSFKEVLSVPEWRSGAYKFLVYIDDYQNAELAAATTFGEIATRLLNENIYFVGWGKASTNKTQFDNLLNTNNNMGIGIYDASFNTYINNTANYIKSLLDQLQKKEVLLVDEPVSIEINPPGIDENTTDALWPYGKWSVDHDYTYYENNMGQFANSGRHTDAMIKTFDKTGRYEIKFRDLPIVPENIYVHRRPTAEISMKVEGSSITVTSDGSFDLDEQSNNNGIKNEEWKWKETNEASWHEGKIPSSIDTSKTYMIQLRVQDWQDEWSYPKVVYTTKDTSALPIANFTLENDTISKYEPLVVTDGSYDPAGRKITSRTWELYRADSKQLLQKSTVGPITDYKSFGTGNYVMYLTVVNEAGQTSERFGRTFTVTNDTIAPEFIAEPTSTDWAKSATVNFKFTDRGGSGFKNYQYFISDTEETPSSWKGPITPTQKEGDAFIDNLTIDEEGEKYLHVIATDGDGNTSADRILGKYKIDKSAPTVSVSGDFVTHTTDDLTIDIHSEDHLSGLKEVTLDGRKLDGLEDTRVKINRNGRYHLKVVDNVGNAHEEDIVVTNIYRKCTAGLEHPDYSSDYDSCPICDLIEGLAITNETVTYNSHGQRVSYDNPVGGNDIIKEYYNGSEDLPVEVGEYDYELKVIYQGEEYRTGKTGKLHIIPKEINIVDIDAVDREYNGTNIVDLVGGKLVGVEESDTELVGFTLPPTGTIPSKNVGQYFVTIPEIVLTGDKSKNYKLIQPEENTVDVVISKKKVEADGGVRVEGITAKSRQYNGTNVVELNRGRLIGIEEVDQGKVDYIMSETGTTPSKDVGIYNVSIPEIILIGEEASNYQITQPKEDEVQVEITQKEINITDIVALNREYDATNIVKLQGGKLVGVEQIDEGKVGFILPETGTIPNKNVGEYFVTIEEILLNGDESHNYLLIQPGPEDVSVTICKKGLVAPEPNGEESDKQPGELNGKVRVDDITATDRIYNGTNVVELNRGTLIGIEEIDQGKVDYIMSETGTTPSKDVGEYNVSIPEITLTGEEANNYAITQPAEDEVSVVITQKEINITDITATDRQYDGTTIVEIQGGKLVGVEEIDDGKVEFELPETGTIPNKDIGTYYVTIGDIPLTNEESKNYKLIHPKEEDVDVNITKRILTVKDTRGKDRRYNKSNVVEIEEGELQNVVKDEDVKAIFPKTGTIPSPNTGQYEVTMDDIVLEGEDIGNYELIQPDRSTILVTIYRPEQPDLHLEPFISKLNGKEVEDIEPIAINTSTKNILEKHEEETSSTNENEKLSNEKDVEKDEEEEIEENTEDNKIAQEIEVTYEKADFEDKIRYGDTIEITIRVYNDGLGAGYAEKIKNVIPEGMKFLENNEVNEEYGWKVIDDKTIETDKLDYKSGEDSEINAVTEEDIDYRDISLVLEVTEEEKLDEEVENVTTIEEVDIEGNYRSDEVDGPELHPSPTPTPDEPNVREKNAIVRRYIYGNKKLDEINTKITITDGVEESEKVNLGTAENVTITKGTHTYTATPRGWARSTLPNADIEVEINGETSVSQNTTFYMSYIYKVEAPFVKPDGSTGKLEQDVYVGAGGNEVYGEIVVSEEDSKVPTNLSSDGWQRQKTEAESEEEAKDVWITTDTKLNDKKNWIDLTKEGTALDADKEYEPVFYKEVIASRYIYLNQKLEDLKETAYRSVKEDTVLPATINLGTTENIQIHGKEGVAKHWSTNSEPDAQGPNGEETENETAVALNGDAHLSKNLTYYMSYRYIDEIPFTNPDGTPGNFEQDVDVSYDGTEKRGDMRIPDELEKDGWEKEKGDASDGKIPNDKDVWTTDPEHPDDKDKWVDPDEERDPNTPIYPVYYKKIIATRYIYLNEKAEDAVGKMYRSTPDNSIIAAPINLGTTINIRVNDQAGLPRHWSTNPSLDSPAPDESETENETAAKLNGVVHLRENKTYYMSYHYINEITYMKPDKTTGITQREVNISYDGNIRKNRIIIPEEDSALPENLKSDGWVRDTSYNGLDNWTTTPKEPKNDNNKIDLSDAEIEVDKNSVLYPVYKKQVTAQRYVYNNQSILPISAFKYRSLEDSTETTADVDLGTTEDVQVETYTAKPMYWSTSNDPKTSEPNESETKDETAVKVNETAHLTKDTTYYMSYLYERDITYVKPDKSTGTAKQGIVLSAGGKEKRKAIDIPEEDSIVPDDLSAKDWTRNKNEEGNDLWTTDSNQASNEELKVDPKNPEDVIEPEMTLYPVYTKEITATRYVHLNQKLEDMKQTGYRSIEDSTIIPVTFNLGTTESIIKPNGTGTPRHWSTDPSPNSAEPTGRETKDETAVGLGEDVHLTDNNTYYMSYHYTIEIPYTKADGSQGKLEQDVYVSYDGTEKRGDVKVPGEEELPPELQGWERDKDEDGDNLWTTDPEDPSNPDIKIDPSDPDTELDPNTPIYPVYRKLVTVTRNVYNSQQLDPLTGYMYRTKEESTITDAVIDIGTADNIVIDTEEAAPKHWSTDPSPNAAAPSGSEHQNETAVKLNGTVHLRKDMTYYMSYHISSWVQYIKSDLTKGTASQDIEIGYNGSQEIGKISIPEEDDKIPESIKEEGWEEDKAENGNNNWTTTPSTPNIRENIIDPKNPTRIVHSGTVLGQVFKKQLTVRRFIYDNQELEQKQTYMYRGVSSQSVIPAEFELGTTTEVRVNQNGHTYNAEPRHWSTGTNPFTSEPTEEGGQDETSVKLNGTAHLTSNATYYMSYTYKKDIKYIKPDASESTADQIVYYNYIGEEFQGAIEVPEEDQIVPNSLEQKGWEFLRDEEEDYDYWTTDPENILDANSRIELENPQKSIDTDKAIGPVFKNDVTVQRFIYPNNSKVEPDYTGTAYRSVKDDTVEPYMVSLGTTTDIMINGETAKPYLWINDLAELDTASDETELEGIQPGGTAAVDINTNFYMIYKINGKDQYVTPDGTIKTLDKEAPKITFVPDGKADYAKTQSTSVTVTDNKGVVDSSLRYQWSQSPNTPREDSFVETFENGRSITKDYGTGNDWYLWILAKDINGNTAIEKSKPFYLDNTEPTITNILPGTSVSERNGGVQLVGTATDVDSGIVGYQYSKNPDLNAYASGWTDIQKTTGQYSAIGYANDAGKWYLYVKDYAGNCSKSSVIVPESSFDITPTISVSPNSAWTKQVTVQITYPNIAGLKKEYVMDGNTYTYSNQFTVTSNTTITARSTLNSVVKEVRREITNIDNTGPTATVSMDNGTATATAQVQDTQSGLAAYRWTLVGNNALQSTNYDSTWLSYNAGNANTSLTLSGIYAIGTLTFYARDTLGNESQNSIPINNPDNSIPDISLVSAISQGITNCPKCNQPSGYAIVTLNYSDVGSGFGGVLLNQYQEITDSEAGSTVTGHAMFTSAPAVGALSGNVVARIYNHGAIAGQSSNMTIRLSDTYGNIRSLKFDVQF